MSALELYLPLAQYGGFMVAFTLACMVGSLFVKAGE